MLQLLDLQLRPLRVHPPLEPQPRTLDQPVHPEEDQQEE